MKLTQIEYALTVRETGSISAAARECNVSQPTLSEGLRLLEEEFGIKLFERHSNGAKPTAEGLGLLEKMEHIRSNIRKLRESAESVSSKTPLSGELKLGIISTVSPYLLPQILEPLTETYPSLDLKLEEGLTEPLLEQIRTHRLDAAIIALPWQTAYALKSYDLYNEPFFLALHRKHHLSDEEIVSEEEISVDELFLLDEGHCLRQHALQVCQAPESKIRQTFRGTSLETIRHLVAAGWGKSLFPALAMDSSCPNIVYKPLEQEETRTISLVTRPSSAKMDDLERLTEFIRETLRPSENLEITDG